MSSKTYSIPEHVCGQFGSKAGPVVFEYEAGEVRPRSVGEAHILEHLVTRGAAQVAPAHKTAKRASAEKEA